jgi:peptide/nickel transport system permease protein
VPVEPFYQEADPGGPAMADQGPAPEVKPRSPRQIRFARRRRALLRFWKEFRQNKLGMVGLVVLSVFILIALFAPLITPRSSTSEVVAAKNDQPITVGPGYHCPQSDIHRVTNPSTNQTTIVENCPSSQKTLYPLGTDGAGRSMTALLVWGARISLLVGLVATVMTMLIGAGIGIAAGFYGGRIDVALSRLTDWFLVIPWIVLAIVLASVLGQSLLNIVLVIGITSWAVTARLVRAQALTVVTRPYVERARALGASNWHIITRHLLPNLFPIIFANTILTVALSILAESTLSFLGLGDPNSVSWGQVLEEAQSAGATTGGQWWWVLPPGVSITTVVLAFTMVGFAIEEITNPRLRRR